MQTMNRNIVNIDYEKLFNDNAANIQSLIDTAKQSIIYDILSDVFKLKIHQLDKAKLKSIMCAIKIDKNGKPVEEDRNKITYMNGVLDGIGIVERLIIERYNRGE